MDSDHGHVITGNLAIVENSKVRTLLEKGLNYREQTAPCKFKAFNAVKMGLTEYIQKISERTSKPICMFKAWKAEILSLVRQQLSSLKSYKFNNVLSSHTAKVELHKLHDKYVLAPTDKAANNVTFICKKYYLQLLDKELNNSGAYAKSTDTVEQVMTKHKAFMLSLGLKIEEDDNNLINFHFCMLQQKCINPLSRLVVLLRQVIVLLNLFPCALVYV